MEADFSGYATKNGLKCSDGRTIMPDAFKHNDQQQVPLVWQHMHGDSSNVLGHAILENRPDGVYAYGFFNETENGKNAKIMVRHGDINALSIYANNLAQRGDNVHHGDIKEVSLVLSGANPGAFIDNVNIKHGDVSQTLDDEAIIWTGLTLEHAEGVEVPPTKTDDMTVQDVLDTFSEEQNQVLYYLLAQVADEGSASSDNKDEAKHGDLPAGSELDAIFHSMTEEQQGVVHTLITEALSQSQTAAHSDGKNADDTIQHQEGTPMTANIFANANATDAPTRKHLSHAQIQTILEDGKKLGSLKESVLVHAAEYGIENIELMFPDARTVSNEPDLIARQAEWVPKVLGATKHSPFAKIKSLAADLTAAEARAKGYVKGSEKTEEVIKMLRRTTGPTTVYKKQKLDRDDIIDITDFDVIAWIKWEIRFMLNEELARAILIGDGRLASSPDKIRDPEGAVSGEGIRSIAHDSALYAHEVSLVANISPEAMIDEITRARVNYRGSGTPTMYTTDTVLTDLLLLKDKMGRRLYDTEAALAAALRVKEIVAVEAMEETPNLLAIIVNLTDFTVGANKGGELTFFEDFDIDYNQNKFLLETRISGALTKPKSAIVVRRQVGTAATATSPSFDGLTNTITIPTTTGVDYLIGDEVVTGTVEILETTEVEAQPQTGYYFPANTNRFWTFVFTD